MATTLAPPSAAPAPSAAPSTPAPSTPSTTPVSTPTPAPITAPETTSAPTSTQQPPAASHTPGSAPTPPSQKDFPGDVEGFLKALHKWDDEHPEAPVNAPEAEVAPGTQLESEAPEAQHLEEAKEAPLDETKPWASEKLNVTPEVVNGWAEKAPELKQVWDQHPEIKNAMFAMARTNAKAAPMLEIYPNVEAAKFAAETSGRYVDLKESFTSGANDPKGIATAYEKLAEEFMVRDEKGQPVLDSQGNPTFFEDFNQMNHLVVDSWLDDAIADAEERFNKSGDDNDEVAANALKYVRDLKKAEGKPATPARDNLTPEQRAWQEQKEAEFAEKERALGIEHKEKDLQGSIRERNQFESQVMAKVGGEAGKRLDNILKEKRANGILVPRLVTEMRDPQTGRSIFVTQVYNDFMQKIQSVPYYRQQLAGLQRLKPGPDAERQRMEFYMQRVDEFLPDIVDDRLRAAQETHMGDARDRQQQRANIDKVAVREPAGGSVVQPQITNDQTAYAQAAEYVAKNFPDLEGRERVAKVLQEKNRRMQGR